ncbi:hypothetical protein N9502_00565 [Vicingaceae bacterium]|nr:hypothetical protein [Vicingaceae bacterium]
MTRILILLFFTLTYSMEVIGQNYMVIGESSYPSTETITLQSDSDVSFIKDLALIFAKDDEQAALIVRSALVSTVRISGKLIIVLNDGTSITCSEKGQKENIDGFASTEYNITQEDLAKLKRSNIQTVNYEIQCADCSRNLLYEGKYSASNRGDSRTNFVLLLTDFYRD